MIDFSVPPELQEIRTRMADFVRDEVLPVEDKLTGDTLEELLPALREKARAAGLWNPHLPEEYDGLGLGPLGIALVQEECGCRRRRPRP